MITPPQQYAWRGFDQLSTTELYLLLRLRCEVFVVEQRCAYLDIDGRDQEADHLLAWGANDRLSGYLRVSRLAKQTHLPRLDGSLPRLKVEVQVSDDGW